MARGSRRSTPVVVARATIEAFIDELEALRNTDERREAAINVIELAAAIATTFQASVDEVEAAASEGYRHAVATIMAATSGRRPS